VLDVDTRNTTVSYVVNGRVSQTAVLDFSDLAVTKTIMDQLSLEAEAADKVKREQGLIIRDSRAVFDAIVDDCALFAKHLNHACIAWKTAHPALPALDTIYLIGAGSMIRGLDDYLTAALKVQVKVANVWVHCLSFDEHVPVIPQDVAVRYGAAIGTTLMGKHMVNLTPDAHQRSLYRSHVARRSGKVLLSFIFGVLVGVAIARVIAIPAVHSKIFEVLHKIQTQW
jgi:Tfp pilus assembly PilM family ATPase